MKKMIITADDFGMCSSVNEAIIDCIEVGVVCSTNVMVNMESAGDATLLRQKYPKLSIGIHYNFTVGKPIRSKEEVKTLVNENGFFHSLKDFRKLYHKKKICNAEIISEMEAQYNEFVALCGAPDYWNSHENVHLDFFLYQIFTNKSERLNIMKMRSNQRIYLPASRHQTMSLKWHLFNPIKTLVINTWQNQSKKKGILSPDGLILCLNEEDKFNFEYLCKNIRWAAKNVAELLIHPAKTLGCEYFGDLTDKRLNEYEYYSKHAATGVANENGISICGYNEIN